MIKKSFVSGGLWHLVIAKKKNKKNKKIRALLLQTNPSDLSLFFL